MRKHHVLEVGHDDESLVVHGLDEKNSGDVKIH
jgi:hypothetical protein